MGEDMARRRIAIRRLSLRTLPTALSLLRQPPVTTAFGLPLTTNRDKHREWMLGHPRSPALRDGDTCVLWMWCDGRRTRLADCLT